MLSISEKIRTVPAFLPLLFFSGGILFQNGTESNDSINFLLLTLIFFSLTITSLNYFFELKNSLADLILIFSFSLSGYIYSGINHHEICIPEHNYYLAEVVSLPTQKKASNHILLRIIGDKNHLYPKKNAYLVNSYFKSGQSRPLPEPGDVILLNTKPRRITNSGNPCEFDYARYLAIKKIFYSCYLEEADWVKTGIAPVSSMLKIWSIRTKKNLQLKIKKTASAHPDLGCEIMLAICTGDKSELDQDMKVSFSNAGAIHVMAVSGLHIGMIWMFLNFLTFFLKKRKAGKIFQFLIIISVLWFYALMTGLSPSVIRSCSMFTIASLGMLIHRQSMIFNTVFIAAFLQLLLNPQILYDAGFQFSYAAVLSILLFQPPLSTILKSKNPLLHKILELINISLSAQFLTFPLSAFYFHQFPVYFLLSNICIIPIVTLLMIGFLTSIIIFFIPLISELFLHLSLRMAQIMELTVNAINQLPGNIITDIDINLLQLFLILLMPLIFLLVYYYLKYYYFLLFSLLFVLIISTGIIRHNQKDGSSLCVFNIRKGTAVYLKHHESNLLLHDSMSERENIDYAISNYILRHFTGKPDFISFEKIGEKNITGFFHLNGKNNFMYAGGNFTSAIINDHLLFKDYRSKLNYEVDIVILGCEPLPSYQELSRNFKIKTIVISSSVPDYVPDISLPDSSSLEYHRVTKDGAFMVKL